MERRVSVWAMTRRQTVLFFYDFYSFDLVLSVALIKITLMLN